MSISPKLTWFYERKRLQAVDTQTEIEQSDPNVYLWRGAKAHKLQVAAGREDAASEDLSDSAVQIEAETSPASSKKLLDKRALQRLKERIGLGGRREYLSKVPVPVMQPESPRLWLFMIVHLLSAYLTLYVDIRVCMLGLVLSAIVFVAAIVLQVSESMQLLVVLALFG